MQTLNQPLLKPREKDCTTTCILPSYSILSVMSLCKFFYPRSWLAASSGGLEMPLLIDMNTDSNKEQLYRKEQGVPFFLALNPCCSQKHQGLQFPIANVPVSAER